MALKGTDDILRSPKHCLAMIQQAKCRLSPLALLALLCASCAAPTASPVKVIVGAKLDPGQNHPRLEHSVIVIRDGKFLAVGPQASTPVPKGSEMISGSGQLVTPVPSTALIAPGEPADLVLRDADTNEAKRVMHDGEWLK